MPSPNYTEAEELSQEGKDFISTLSMAKTFTGQPVYQHEGFWYHDRNLLGVMACQKHFEARDSDVFVISSPKCGTTWLKALTFALLNREQRHPIDSQNHPLLTANPHDLVPHLELELYTDSKIPADMERSFPCSPRLFATHMPHAALPDSVRERGCRVVYVSRDPKDAFVSLWHFVVGLGIHDPACSIEEAFEYFCRGLSMYGPSWDHASGYWKWSLQSPEKVLFLKYEGMMVEATQTTTLRRLAHFLGCPFSADEEAAGVVDRISKLCSFQNLSTLQVNKDGKLLAAPIQNSGFFRRGQVGDWKNHLSADMAQRLDRIIRDNLSSASG